MPYYSKEFVRDSIDDELFEPLKDYLLLANQDYKDLEEIIINSKRPIYRKSKNSWDVPTIDLPLYRGFVLEKSVQLSLSRFAKSSNLLFLPQLDSFFTLNGYKIKSNNWGNIEFYKTKGGSGTEIDALYEFHQSLNKIPIIFEISYTSSGKKSNLKRMLVGQLYDTSALFCKIRPNRNDEDLGLYKREDNARQIQIPYEEFLDEVALNLWKYDGQRFNKSKAIEFSEITEKKPTHQELIHQIQKPTKERIIATQIIYDKPTINDVYHPT